jgi:hypothetical protein
VRDLLQRLAEPGLSPYTIRDLAHWYEEEANRRRVGINIDQDALDRNLRRLLAERGVFPEFIAVEFERVMKVVFPGSAPNPKPRPNPHEGRIAALGDAAEVVNPPGPRSAAVRRSLPPLRRSPMVERKRRAWLALHDLQCAADPPRAPSADMTMDRIQGTLTLPQRPGTLTAAGAAEIAAKSLRKAQTTIGEAGADNIVVVLQGHLVAGDRVAEAGLSAQPKVQPKAEGPSPQATKNNDGAVSTEVAAHDL